MRICTNRLFVFFHGYSVRYAEYHHGEGAQMFARRLALLRRRVWHIAVENHVSRSAIRVVRAHASMVT